MNSTTLLQEPWLKWAMEIQSIAQAGLTYSTNVYDLERFERLREISAEMLSVKTGISVEKVKDLFCNEIGYQTPKIDTRAAIFQGGKILLVQENDGLWSLPGGWVDVFESLASNTIKEVKEEAGLDVIPERVIALHDRIRHNPKPFPYGIIKTFIQCKLIGGEFAENSETIASGYFALDELPPLSEEKNTKAQIALCFEAYHSKFWVTQFD
ncbi:ADP-ribose pyrophosphatase YjhB (NUDIX family) [Cricetibacter osteomyelitidis]|uniref:ADP-ribose pyrophosphatase YjhB (NUDIX family) n=1 Tax=Cricetibacter osteomyelitidis TaxID=1521931 RepID=A0A4R2SPT8_9PAST|nr:NUDIX hydrolase [Cricetibacter osteomyelitidis]TCP92187.1 ADP-ribose pyrophosphatase YjhB (NUDIX family) [Cricetibacter osteomyelitidis]